MSRGKIQLPFAFLIQPVGPFVNNEVSATSLLVTETGTRGDGWGEGASRLYWIELPWEKEGGVVRGMPTTFYPMPE